MAAISNFIGRFPYIHVQMKKESVMELLSEEDFLDFNIVEVEEVTRDTRIFCRKARYCVDLVRNVAFVDGTGKLVALAVFDKSADLIGTEPRGGRRAR